MSSERSCRRSTPAPRSRSPAATRDRPAGGRPCRRPAAATGSTPTRACSTSTRGRRPGWRPKSSPAVEQRLAHRLTVLPGAEELPARLARPCRAGVRGRGRPAIVTVVMLKNLSSGGRAAEHPLDHAHRVRPLNLEAVRLAAPVRAQRRALVERDLDVIAARLGVVGDPVERGRTADEVEAVLGEVEEDHVADHVAVGRARHEVLGLVDAEVLEAVDGRGCESRFSASGPFDREIGHVVRLVEEDAGRLPGLLLVAPVRELGRDARVDVRPSLRVAQELDRALDGRRAGLAGSDHASSSVLSVMGSAAAGAAAPCVCSPR